MAVLSESYISSVLTFLGALQKRMFAYIQLKDKLLVFFNTIAQCRLYKIYVFTFHWPKESSNVILLSRKLQRVKVDTFI